MLKGKCFHSTVSIGKKLFVIDRSFNNGCEVFDSVTNKFTSLNNNLYLNKNLICPLESKAFTVGYKIYVFIVIYLGDKIKISNFCYDVKEKSWTSENYFNLKFSYYFGCAKMFER